MLTAAVHAALDQFGSGAPPELSRFIIVAVVLVVIVLIGVVSLILTRSGGPSRRFRRVGLAGVALASVATAAWAYSVKLPPIAGSAYFCATPDPSPVASVSASIILQSCDAGKTITLAKGDTIAVDLLATTGVDTWYHWSDPTASDGTVLTRVRGPLALYSDRERDSGPSVEEVAVYSATQAGQAALSAVEQFCNGNTQTCDIGYRWMVTIQVT